MSLALYHKTKNKEYLLRAAVFEFEAANEAKKITPKVIDSVKENSNRLSIKIAMLCI